MSSQSIAPSRMRWDINASKREANTMVYRAVAFDLAGQYKRVKRTLRVLSFPADTWLWEQGMREVFSEIPMRFIGLEQDPKVYRKSAKVASGLPAAFRCLDRPTSFLEFAISGKKQEFDMVYLDWMGTWSKDKKSDIAALFSRRMLSVGGLLLVTVSLRRGYPDTNAELSDLSYDLPLAFYDARGEDKYVSNIKVRGIPHWIQGYAMDNGGVSMRPLMASVYYSRTGISNQTQPQLQILMLNEGNQ